MQIVVPFNFVLFLRSNFVHRDEESNGRMREEFNFPPPQNSFKSWNENKEKVYDKIYDNLFFCICFSCLFFQFFEL